MKRLILLALFLLAPFSTHAASLYLSPATLTLGPGQAGTFTVYVESAGQAMNAVSGSIALSASGVSLVGVSKTGSIVSFWGTEPTTSGGTLSFEGVVLNPGYTGAGGKVVSFSVKAGQAGTYSAQFINGKVLANDGKGTDITSGTRGASITVSAGAPKDTPAPEPEVSQQATPSAFRISSETHPSERAWYRETKGTFTWEVPQGATATRLVLSSSPSTPPSVVYDTPIGSKTIENLPEGVSYLRVQHKVGGVWGGIGTYTVQIDTTPPERFDISFPHGTSGINPQPIMYFNTTDRLSSVDHYDVRVGEGSVLAVAASADSNPYTLPLQEPGSHVVAVTAYDAAGNTRTESAGFFVEGIDLPKITEYPETIAFGDLFKVRGLTYPNATVEISVQKNGEHVVTESTKSNSPGDFATVLAKRLEPGTYTLSARVIDARGARSAETEPVVFKIQGNIFTDIAFFAQDHWFVALLIVLVLAGLVVLHIHGWHNVFSLVRNVHIERAEATRTAHRAFALLRKDLDLHIKKLRTAEKTRELTEEEIAFLEQFEQDLEDTETIVNEELRNHKN